MKDKRLFYWSITPNPYPAAYAGMSASIQAHALYFSTQRKLEKWQRKNTDLNKEATWAMHEITLSVAKELIKLSKKKPKATCEECGK